jgi:hypothetical protein
MWSGLKNLRKATDSFSLLAMRSLTTLIPCTTTLALVPGEEDGDFYAREFLFFDLTRTKVVLLMACETLTTAIESLVGIITAGLGADLLSEQKLNILQYLVPGDGLVGLSRAFLLAGAEAVLANHLEAQVGEASQLTSAFWVRG